MRVKINPLLRKDGAILSNKETDTIHKDKTYIAISRESKTYSFLVKIIEKNHSSDYSSPIPILDVDKYLPGILAKDDLVELYSYNVPMAESITIGMSKKDGRGIVKGDWSSTLRETLVGNAYDIGNRMKVATDYDGNMLIIRGILTGSYPSAPVLVGPTTKILIEKFEEEEFNKKREKIDQKKIKRVNELRKMILNSLKIESAHAKKSMSSIIDEIEFDSVDPKMIYNTIDDIFIGYELINEDVNEENGKYTGTRAYAIKNVQNKFIEIVEYTISAFESHGTVSIRVFSESSTDASKKARELWRIVSKMNLGLKEEAITLDTICPICGGELNIDKIDGEGMAKCKFCRKKSKVQNKYD